MEITESIQNIVDKFSGSGDVKKLYGDPVEKNGKTIIPVASIGYGFGGGMGKHGESHPEEGEGGGGGGGIQAKPIGIVEITDKGTRFIRFNQLPMLFTIMVVAWTVRSIVRTVVKKI